MHTPLLTENGKWDWCVYQNMQRMIAFQNHKQKLIKIIASIYNHRSVNGRKYEIFWFDLPETGDSKTATVCEGEQLSNHTRFILPESNHTVKDIAKVFCEENCKHCGLHTKYWPVISGNK